jgi:hypothetical protein
MLNLNKKAHWLAFCCSVCTKKTLNAKGVKMKKVIIGIAMAVCFNMGFGFSGAGNHPTTGSMPGISIEKAFAADSAIAPNTLKLHKQPAPEASIFSWTMILYLSVAVIIIISIRRNTYV